MMQQYSQPHKLASDPAAYYRQNSVMTASPERLVVMTYDGLLRALGRAKAALDSGNEAGMMDGLKRAQDIVTELMVSLEPGYEISHSLFSLYDYFYRRLIAANLERDRGIIEEVEGLVKELRDAWAEAAEKISLERRRAVGERA